MSEERLLKRKEASAFLESDCGVTVAVSTLSKYATLGGGPAYQKFGKVPLYAREDLRLWARAKLRPKVTSSTELQALERANALA